MSAFMPGEGSSPSRAARQAVASRTWERRPAHPLAHRLLWIGHDLLMTAVAALWSAWLVERELGPLQWSLIGLFAAVLVSVGLARGLYRSHAGYTGLHEPFAVMLGGVCGITAVVVLTYFLNQPNSGMLGRVYLVHLLASAVALCVATRLAVRLRRERSGRTGNQVVILGSGTVGELTLRDLRNRGHRVTAFIDLDESRHGDMIHGRRVLGGIDTFAGLPAARLPDMLAIAQEVPPEQLRAIFRLCMDRGIRVRMAHAPLSGEGGVTLKNLAVEDLLQRPRRHLDPVPVQDMLRNAVVLITGAGGSIGSELCRQAAAGGASRLVLIDHSEFNLYQIHNDLRTRFPKLNVTPMLASLTDREGTAQIIAACQPDLVLHAAAYKHVPMVELNPFLGVANNLGGFRNLLDACIANGVPRLVAISTDKAVRPTNVMGASKRACEVLLQGCDHGRTRLCAVRFGNVLGSSGSVVPLFLEQIRTGGPVTVTHPDMTRYFMLIPEAVELVLQAGAMAEHGEIFILDMGDPVRIADLARQLIWMTGHVPDGDIRITYSGLRPGEKLFEELLLSESEGATTVGGIHRAHPSHRDPRQLDELSARLLAACQDRDLEVFVKTLLEIVPEWAPSAEFNAILRGQTDQFPALPPETARILRPPRKPVVP